MGAREHFPRYEQSFQLTLALAFLLPGYYYKSYQTPTQGV